MAHSVRTVTFKEFRTGDFEVTSKISTLLEGDVDRRRKGNPTIRSAFVSRNRAHKNLFEILRSNVWKYFLTLTFGMEGREDDDVVISAFQSWRKYIKKKFPQMTYVAVPEYHLQGCLHFHLVVGNVSAAQLDLVDSGRVLHFGKAWLLEDFIRAGFRRDDLTGEGLPIYNVGSFEFGFSTATEVRSPVAVIRYIGKYISKSNIDPRFYNKHRYFCSHNVQRPYIVQDKEDLQCSFYDLSEERDLKDLYGCSLSYENPSMKYRKYDTSLCKEDMIRLRLCGELPDLPSDDC